MLRLLLSRSFTAFVVMPTYRCVLPRVCLSSTLNMHAVSCCAHDKYAVHVLCSVNYPADKGDFAKNPDGSVTFWLSHKPPGPPGSPKYQNW